VRCTLDRENALVHVTADVSCDGQTGVTASAKRVALGLSLTVTVSKRCPV